MNVPTDAAPAPSGLPRHRPPPQETNPAALQPPGTVGLVLFRFVGLGAGLVPRFHDRPGLGPFDGPSLGILGVDAHGAVLLIGDPVAWVRPPAIETAGRRLRTLENDAGEAGAADGTPWPFGRLCREAATPELVVGRIRLDTDALERLARAMADRAAGVVPPTWPVRFVTIGRSGAAGTDREASS